MNILNSKQTVVLFLWLYFYKFVLKMLVLFYFSFTKVRQSAKVNVY